MKREAFFAECLSFAMKTPPKERKPATPYDMCPRYWTPSIVGTYQLWLQGEETTGSL